MGLGGAGGTAAAVTTGGAAQQDHHIAGVGALPADIFRRSGGDDSADLHALGGIAGVVDFVHNAGGQTDLVAVGGIACGGGGDNLPLGQLAGDGLGDGLQGVGCAGDTHGAVDIASAGQGIPDSAADTGGSTAEGLNLRGMVVGFVLEQQQPGLGNAVHGDIDLHGAGVDFLGLVQLGQLAVGLQMAHSHGGQIHQTDGLVTTTQSLPGCQILFVGLLQQLVLKGDAVDDGAEGGVAAVIGPVGVDHPDFGDGGVPILLLEVALAEGDVVQIHGKAILLDEGSQTVPVQTDEARKSCHLGGDVVLNSQSVIGIQRSLPGLHGVDDILLDGGNVGIPQVAVQGVDLGGADQGTLPLRDDLDALGGGVGSLVELTGQGLHGEHHSPGQLHGRGGNVQLGLGKDGLDGVVKQLFCDVFRIVTVEQPHIGEAVNAQQIPGVVEKTLCLVGKTLPLFYKYTINHGVISS